MGLLLQISDFVVYLAGTPYMEGQVLNPAIADPPMMWVPGSPTDESQTLTQCDAVQLLILKVLFILL